MYDFSNAPLSVMLQATFLRMGAAGDHSRLEEELEALNEDDLDRRCRRNGICTKNGRSAMVRRANDVES